MKLTDFVADVPEDVWAVFEPILPPAVWKGVGCKPYSNRECLHALLYVLIAGIGWEFLPPGLPSRKTVQRRLETWLALDCFHTAWAQLPSATCGCAASTGTRSSSTAPRSRPKRGRRHRAVSRGSP